MELFKLHPLTEEVLQRLGVKSGSFAQQIYNMLGSNYK
jgi:hypothetical protein